MIWNRKKDASDTRGTADISMSKNGVGLTLYAPIRLVQWFAKNVDNFLEWADKARIFWYECNKCHIKKVELCVTEKNAAKTPPKFCSNCTAPIDEVVIAK